jgi:hypothetical protein
MKTETMETEVRNDKRAWSAKIAEYKAHTAGHDLLDCECEECIKAVYLELDYKDTLRLTTDHAASSYGLPVLVDGDDIAYGTADVTPIGAAMPLYHNIENRDGWRLHWEDCGNTLVGVYKVGK